MSSFRLVSIISAPKPYNKSMDVISMLALLFLPHTRRRMLSRGCLYERALIHIPSQRETEPGSAAEGKPIPVSLY